MISPEDLQKELNRKQGKEGGSATVALASAVCLIGRPGYGFGTQSAFDLFATQSGTDPDQPAQVLACLRRMPQYAVTLMWELLTDAGDTVVIRPAGPFAIYAYENLLEFLSAEQSGQQVFASLSGRIVDIARLRNGQMVPVVEPELNSMYSWPSDRDDAWAMYLQCLVARKNRLLNAASWSAEMRAANFAITYALRQRDAVHAAFKAQIELLSIVVHSSTQHIKRGSGEAGLWDVVMVFACPKLGRARPRHEHLFTVDVSQVTPVLVARSQRWDG